jgi:hypothetical protein
MGEILKQQRRVKDEDLSVVNFCRRGEISGSAGFDSTLKVSPG